MDDSREYEFEAGNIAVSCVFETQADEHMIMAAIEAGLNATQTIVAITEVSELSILICDDETIKDINLEWRNKNYATNVLSFPAPQDAKYPIKNLGDMAIGLPITENEARTMGISLADHVTHLAIHSVLHLLGYDHENEHDALIMEALEIKAMANIGLANPYENDMCRSVIIY